jgi:hypothetical protein
MLADLSVWRFSLIRIGILASVAFSPLLATCAGTSRVDATVTPAALAQDKKAVAIMRIGAASPTCKHVAVLLGTREGDGYRRHSVLQVMNVHSLVEPAVAETELAAGTYHVIGYSCHDGKKPGVVADKADPGFLATPGTYRTSYAQFNVHTGEIVNVGYLHFHASRVGTNAFGRPVRTQVTISDWPLAELDRFKQKRPRIYAQMVTRLLTATDNTSDKPSSDDCARLAALLAEGKVQTLPPVCSATPMAGAQPRKPL